MYARFGKRIFDLVIILPSLILLFPLALIVGILVRIKLGAPVLFRQQRPGMDGEIFTLYKFRSMGNRRDAAGNLLPDEDRLTRLGLLLRKMSLDELPGLLNVLKGEMSLVGPRPLLVRYMDRYTPEQMRRHDVRPGITGWAQVNGRNSLSWEEKFELDIWYVDNLSFLLDCRILLLTLLKTISQEGISQPGHATMEEFFGSRGV